MNDKLNIILDTNIFYNGIFQKKNNPYCSKIMKWVENDKFNLVFAQDTFGELSWKLKTSIQFFIKDESQRIQLLKDIMELFYHSITINTVDKIAPTCNDKNDNMFLKLAIGDEINNIKIDYLVTDDYSSGMHKIIDDRFKVLDSKQFVDVFYNIIKESDVAIGKV